MLAPPNAAVRTELSDTPATTATPARVLAAQGHDDRPEREMGARSPRDRDNGASRTLRYLLARWVTTKAWSAQRWQRPVLGRKACH